MDGAGVIQSGDFEIQSSHETPEEMRQALAVNEPATETPVEDVPESTDKPEQAEPPKQAPPQGDRDPQTGQFKKPAKPRNDPQARIDQAIAKQREAERRAEAAERRAAEIEAQRKSEPPPPAPTPKPQPPPPPRAASDPNDPEPNPDDLTTYPDGQFDRKYMRDVAQWVARQELRQERAAQQQSAADEAKWKALEQHAAEFSKRLDEAEAADPGFMARAYQPVADAKPISAYGPEDYARLQALPPRQRNEAAFHAFLAERVFRSEHPRELLLHFTEPGVIQRLATLHPNEVIQELAIFGARLGAATSAAPAPKAEVSHAKPPIQPLGSSPHAADPNELSDDLPIEEWIRRGNAKERASGRR